jgi:signal transduction histidine kinase
MGGMGAGRRQEALSETELDEAIKLYNDGEVIGYLLPEQRIVPLPGIETTLLQRLSRSAVTAAGIAILLSAVLSILLAYALLRPIRELTHAARAMGKGDLNQRVKPRGNGETALLAKTFNEMADSLQTAETRRRALTADIAHELRNPLAIQRANIEAMQDGLYPVNTEQLEPIRQQNMQLERLVEDLRTLALADTGHLELVRVPTNLPALLQRRLDELKPEMDAKKIKLASTYPNSMGSINLDPSRFGQIITNLMANAMRYSPEGGTISVELSETAGDIIITVRDQGPGISPEDLPLIFERFYRGDKARSRDNGSTGLGLSIARRLAQAHGGFLEAKNHSGGGAVFQLTLPK